LLHQKRQELQLQQFLAGQLIQNATIDGIGKGRKATLNAYGIDSAADITRGIQVPGFGQVLIGNLIAWRSYCEKAFRYNPNVPLPPAEVNAVKLKHAKRRQAALAELRSGATKLESLEQTTRMAASRTRMAILHFSRGHVQAIADLTVCH
jgi:DNA-binding helix-hairpin-helix protein with protein kinase domain